MLSEQPRPTTTSRARAKSKGAPRAKSKPPKKEQGNTTWVDDLESTVKIEEIPEWAIHEDHSATYTESFAVNSPTPQAGTTVQRHLAKGVTPNKGVTSDNPNKAPILDTGTTRCLLHLSWMSKDVIEKAERIHLGVANETRSRALLLKSRSGLVKIRLTSGQNPLKSYAFGSTRRTRQG